MGINILENEQPIVINAKLAKIVGLSESIVLQQMNYWIEKSKHIIERKRWIYNTYSNWQEQLPFFCESTIRRIIKKLEASGIIISGNFNKSKKDNTKWYTINFEALDKLVNDFYNRNSNDMDENASANTEQLPCSNLSLNMLNLSTPLPEITTETNLKEEVLEEKVMTPGVVTEKGKGFNDIINFFNSNIHLITPHECEKLKLLHEEIKNPDLIFKAMEIAVENRARSFRYIEVILYNWMNLNLHTLEEVEDYISSNNSNTKGRSTVNTSKEGGDNHGEDKYSKWGSGQYSGNYKKAQDKSKGKYAGFKPGKPTIPELTEEDYEGLI